MDFPNVKGRGILEAEYIRQSIVNATLAGKNVTSVPNSMARIRTAGRILGGAGLGLTVTDMALHGVNRRNSLDLTMGGVSFIPKIGWAVGGAYFLTNIGLSVAGKHIADFLPTCTNSSYTYTGSGPHYAVQDATIVRGP